MAQRRTTESEAAFRDPVEDPVEPYRRPRPEEVVSRAIRTTDRWTDRVLFAVEMAKMRLLPAGRLGRPLATQEQTDAEFLRGPALLGLLALTAVAVGASLPSSPFKTEIPGTWFFGLPRDTGPDHTGLLFGLVAVYGGLILFMRVWYRMTKAVAARPGLPVRKLGWVFALWAVPMLIVPPLFSQDIFSYAAQGEMVSHHISPYLYGPGTLSSGNGTPYLNGVNHLWLNTPAPYGPLFLIVDGLFASLSFHHVLGTLVLLRLLALLGAVLIATTIPRLARLHGRDPSTVFTLAVLNPLVLLSLVTSAHNDAVMLGLMLWGMVLAKEGRPVLGVMLCASAAAIKVPAELAVLYIGWSWLGPSVPWRQRIRPVVTALMVSAGVMLAFTLVSGFGLGWISKLETPGTVTSWLAPTTGVGLGITHLAHLVHLGVSQGGILSVTRVIGELGAAVAGVWLLLNSDRLGTLRALGYSLLLFVLLGPVVQPWYLTWGLLTLAVVAGGWTRRLILVLSVLSPFIGLPGGRELLDGLIHSDPLAVAGSLIVLLGVFLAPLGRWARSEGRMALSSQGLDRGSLSSGAASAV